MHRDTKKVTEKKMHLLRQTKINRKIKETAKLPDKLLAKLPAEMYPSDKSLNENCEYNLK